MITELIFSVTALVFYFGIEGYYYYKDKVSDEDPITETTYTHGGSVPRYKDPPPPPPKKELTFADIEEGDTVTLFRYYKSGNLINKSNATIEGVVTHTALNLIRIGNTWYEEIKDKGWCHKLVHIKKPKTQKTGNPELKHNPTLKCTITNKTFGVKDLVVFKYMNVLYYDQKGVPFLAPSSDKISGVIAETSDVGPSFRIGDEWFPMDRGKGGIIQIESVKRGPEYLYDDPVLLKMDSGELIMLDKDQQLQMKKQWALVGQQGVQGFTGPQGFQGNINRISYSIDTGPR